MPTNQWAWWIWDKAWRLMGWEHKETYLNCQGINDPRLKEEWKRFLCNMVPVVQRQAGHSRLSDGTVPKEESRMLDLAIDQYGGDPMAFHGFYHFKHGTLSTRIWKCPCWKLTLNSKLSFEFKRKCNWNILGKDEFIPYLTVKITYNVM